MARDHVTPERPLTPAEAADLFGVDTKTIGRWARAGKLPALRTVGGHHRFDPAEMRRILAGTPAGPPESPADGVPTESLTQPSGGTQCPVC